MFCGFTIEITTIIFSSLFTLVFFRKSAVNGRFVNFMLFFPCCKVSSFSDVQSVLSTSGTRQMTIPIIPTEDLRIFVRLWWLNVATFWVFSTTLASELLPKVFWRMRDQVRLTGRDSGCWENYQVLALCGLCWLFRVEYTCNCYNIPICSKIKWNNPWVTPGLANT